MIDGPRGQRACEAVQVTSACARASHGDRNTPELMDIDSPAGPAQRHVLACLSKAVAMKTCMRGWLGISIAAATLLMAACGGGGGSSPGVREALPQLVQDVNPGGTRLDLRVRNYFPANAGDTWTFDRVQNGVTTVSAMTRSVQSVVGNDAVFTESESGTTSSATYRRSAEGIVSVDPLADVASPSARALVGDLLDFAEPFYPVGAVRRIIRQGSWGADLDGDGTNESFRLEITQLLVGFETLALPLGSAETAHFRGVTQLTLSPSSLAQRVITVTATEDSWWAPDIGMVRTERVATDSDGVTVIPAHTFVIASGTVAGTALFQPPLDGTLRKLPLVHNALVFDAARQRYYASIPGSVVGNGNSIASIDPSTGAVSYSAPVGSEPFALALAADGSALYAGLNGSGDVVKLRLPDFVELSRTRLPAPAFYGQMLAETIAVSPLDPDVVAVSMLRTGLSPRHGGVVLIRAGVLQPRQTQDHTGSNLITFDANGQFVYGLNNETTEFGLRRIEVLADGLAEQAVVTTDGGFGVGSLDFTPQGLVLDHAVYRTPDLALLGRAAAPSLGCRAHSVANRLVCAKEPFPSNGEGRLVVIDASTYVIQSTPVYAWAGLNAAPSQLQPGPAGQVALRFGATFFSAPASELWLFTSPALQ